MSKKAPWVVIVGAGFGGLTVALELDDYLVDHPGAMQVVLVDLNHSLVIGTANQFALFGRSRPEQVTSSYADLSLKNVYFVQDQIISINTESRVVFGRGHKFRFDKLVLALGAEFDYLKVPGLVDSAYNVAKMDEVMQLKDALADFRGGAIVVTVGSVPCSGPATGFEYACLVRSLIKSKNNDRILKNTKIILTTPEKNAWPEENPSVMLTVLAEKNIQFLPGYSPLHVDTKQRAIFFTNGEKIKFDILVAHFPHKAPKLLVESKFCEPDGFVKSDVWTCKTSTRGVYAIGDCTDMTIPGKNKPHPKAGVFSVNQGLTVAADLIQSVANEEEEEEDWDPSSGQKQSERAVLVAEVGNNQAVKVTMDFFNVDKDSAEQYDVEPPSKANMKEMINWWDRLIKRWFTQ